MALYTLKSRDEAILPLLNYNGNSNWIRGQISSFGGAPTPDQTQLYNAIGRTEGENAGEQNNDNFFSKRFKSIENALGTTGASVASFFKSGIDGIGGAAGGGAENLATKNLLRDTRSSMNDIAKKYGYNSWSDWQDAYAAAREAGDEAKINEFKTQLTEFQNQANTNADKANRKAADYKDYMDNNYVSEKINQDRGKFAGSAINTLSTAVDVTGLGANPLSNAAQGAVEGLADELEQNGLENFDWGRAGQNAAIGAATGAATGALNAGISSSLAKRAAAKGLTNTATKAGVGSVLKNGAKTIATGAARGALSGAVGGATGAGLQSALNGVELGQGVQNALQGAVQGAQQGAVTGGIMAGANAAFGKTNFGRQLQNAKTNWDQSGSNFDERLTNTLTSGDSAVGDWIMNRRQSKLIGELGNTGLSVRDVSGTAGGLGNRAQEGSATLAAADNMERFDELPPDIQKRMRIAAANGASQNDLDTAATAFLSAQADSIRGAYANYNSTMKDYFRIMKKYGSDLDLVDKGNWNETQRQAMQAYNNAKSATPTTAKGWAKKAGERFIEDANNKGVGLSIKDVSKDMPEDIRNLQIRDFTADEADTTYGIANDPRVRRQLIANVEAQLAENPNAKIGDANFDADAIISEYGDRLTPAQYNKFNPVDAENALVQELQNIEAQRGFGESVPETVTQRTVSQMPQGDAWDRVAQEAGYSNYNEVLRRFAEANPNAEINPRGMAGQVLTWMDENPNTPATAGDWAKRAGQRAVEDLSKANVGLSVKDVSQEDASKRLYNALVGNGQPTAETEAMAEATTQPDVIPSKTSKEGKMRYAQGKELLAQYGPVDQPTARSTRAVESVQKIAEAGFTRPEDVEKMVNVVTGSNGEVSKLTKNLIENAAPVNTFDGPNGQTIDEYVDDLIQRKTLSGTTKGNAVKQTIQANLRSLPSRASGSVSYDDNPADVFRVVQNLEASAAELEGRGGNTYHRPTVENINQAKVLKDTASLLKDRLFDSVDVKAALTPEVAQNLKAYDPNNKAWANYVDNEIMGANSIKDLRAVQAPWVRMSKHIDNAYTQAATVGGRMASNANDLSRILTTRNGLLRAGIDALWNSNAAHRGRAAVYDKMADNAAKNAAKDNPTTAAGWAKEAGKRAAEDLGNTNVGLSVKNVSQEPVRPIVSSPTELADATTNYNPQTQLYNAIGRTEGNLQQQNTARYLVDAAQEAEIVPTPSPVAPLGVTTTVEPDTATAQNSNQTALYNTLTNTPTSNNMMQTTNAINTGYYQPTGDYWTDIIASAMSAAIDADDVKAFTSLYGMYQDALANATKSSSKEKDYSDITNWTSSDRSKLLSAQDALGQIDQLESAYTQATGGNGSNAIQGWLRSRASDLSGGNLDPSAANYNSLSESVGMGIVKNLINLGVTESDAQRYLKYIPSLTDTKEQAATKLETLRGIYQNQINNLYGAYGL